MDSYDNANPNLVFLFPKFTVNKRITIYGKHFCKMLYVINKALLEEIPATGGAMQREHILLHCFISYGIPFRSLGSCYN